MSYKFSHPVVEDTIWLQKQAPAGNWLDYTGFSGPEAIEHALEHEKFYTDRGETTRIVRYTVEVLITGE